MKKSKLLLVLFGCFVLQISFAQQNTIDSLSALIKNAKHDTIRARAYWDLSEEFFSNDPDTVIPLCKMSIDIIDKDLGSASPVEKKTFLIIKAMNYNSIGSINTIKGRDKEALDYQNLALKLYVDLNHKIGIAASLNNIAYIYDNQGRIKEALDYYGRSIKIMEELQDRRGMAVTFNNIGYIYLSQKQLSEALVFFDKSLKIREELSDKKGMGNVLNNTGLVYRELDKIEKALEYFQRSLKIREELGDKNGIGNSLNNIGALYLLSGKTKDALAYHQRALKIYEEIQDKRGLANSLYRMGSALFRSMQNEQAGAYAKRALDIARQGGYVDKIRDAEKLLSQTDSARGDFLHSLDHYKQFIYYHDSLVNEENTKKTVQTQMQYEFDKEVVADSISNAERMKQEGLKHDQEIRQQKIYAYGGVIGFLMMMVVAGVSFRAFKQKQKANEFISIQKKIVEEKQKEILDSIRYAKRIQQSLLPTDTFLQRCFARLRKN